MAEASKGPAGRGGLGRGPVTPRLGISAHAGARRGPACLCGGSRWRPPAHRACCLFLACSVSLQGGTGTRHTSAHALAPRPSAPLCSSAGTKPLVLELCHLHRLQVLGTFSCPKLSQTRRPGRNTLEPKLCSSSLKFPCFPQTAFRREGRAGSFFICYLLKHCARPQGSDLRFPREAALKSRSLYFKTILPSMSSKEHTRERNPRIDTLPSGSQSSLGPRPVRATRSETLATVSEFAQASTDRAP